MSRQIYKNDSRLDLSNIINTCSNWIVKYLLILFEKKVILVS